MDADEHILLCIYVGFHLFHKLKNPRIAADCDETNSKNDTQLHQISCKHSWSLIMCRPSMLHTGMYG